MSDIEVEVEVERLRAPLVEEFISRLELTEDDARVTVDHLIRAEQAGKSSHGLIRVSYTTRSGKFGPYRRRPSPSPERIAPGRMHVDGTGHFGYPVLHRLVEKGCDEALENGTCVATSASVYPSGAIGDWARQACTRGVAVVFVASSPIRVAPDKVTHPVVGTNPICIGIPTEPMPYVGDFATSEITHGTLLLARSSGESLPTTAAVGSDGRPATSASALHPSQGQGALLPFGGHYKAFALSMGIELLVSMGGGLPGSERQEKNGVFCLFIGPKSYGRFLASMSEWLVSLDGEGIRVPGWTSGRRGLEQQTRGVVRVAPETFKTIAHLLPPGGAAPTTQTKRGPDAGRSGSPAGGS